MASAVTAAVPLLAGSLVANVYSSYKNGKRAKKQQAAMAAAQRDQQAEISRRKNDLANRESALKNIFGGSRGGSLYTDDDGLGGTFG